MASEHRAWVENQRIVGEALSVATSLGQHQYPIGQVYDDGQLRIVVDPADQIKLTWLTADEAWLVLTARRVTASWEVRTPTGTPAAWRVHLAGLLPAAAAARAEWLAGNSWGTP